MLGRMVSSFSLGMVMLLACAPDGVLTAQDNAGRENPSSRMEAAVARQVSAVGRMQGGIERQRSALQRQALQERNKGFFLLPQIVQRPAAGLPDCAAVSPQAAETLVRAAAERSGVPEGLGDQRCPPGIGVRPLCGV